MGTTLRFLNHSSVIVEYDDNENQQTVMTASWFQQSAFAPRLSVPSSTFQPAFITSLSDDSPGLKNQLKVPGFKSSTNFHSAPVRKSNSQVVSSLRQCL
tara:strand:- start:223171 stop:223467 length:297 start_codon:yes stop_codon:yes gene_type:complete